jgi:hypothetical protein
VRYPDTRTEEYVYFLGGPKDDGWEIIPKSAHEMLIPVAIPVAKFVLAEDIDLATIPQLITASYRYNGRRLMAENLFGVMVQFRVFEWEGER